MRNLWTDMGFRNAAYRVHRFEVWQMHLHTHTHIHIPPHTHSQYTSTVRVKVSDPATLLAVIWYTPLSLRVTSAIVTLVTVTVIFGSLMGVPFLVNVILSTLELASSGREKVNSCPFVGVVVAVVHENHGVLWWSSGGQRKHNPV